MGWDLFGTERTRAWAAFAASVGGTFEAGGLFGKDAIHAPFGAWTVRITLYDAQPGKGRDLRTQAAVELAAPPGLDLHVRLASVLDSLVDLLTTPEITLGDAGFDAKFHVRASDPALAAAVLTPSIRDALLGLRGPSIDVERETALLLGNRGPRLRVEVDGRIDAAEELRRLWRLTAEVVESLAQHGAIAAAAP